MPKEELIELSGLIIDVLPDSRYKVKLENDHTIIAYASGKILKNHIRLLLGNKVTVQLSPYDLSKGRISFRQ